jgi:thioredoxin-dependent peroxiredoxin
MKTLAEGSPAPDFELPDQDGNLTRLSRLLKDGPVVLFFYPAAETPGCTKEACYFRNLDAEFEAAGAQRVGISRDSVAKQKAFADKHHLGYTLLADVDGEVAAEYGVKRGLLGALAAVKRSTFVIGSDQVIKRVVSSELNMDLHADEALATLRDL